MWSAGFAQPLLEFSHVNQHKTKLPPPGASPAPLPTKPNPAYIHEVGDDCLNVAGMWPVLGAFRPCCARSGALFINQAKSWGTVSSRSRTPHSIECTELVPSSTVLYLPSEFGVLLC